MSNRQEDFLFGESISQYEDFDPERSDFFVGLFFGLGISSIVWALMVLAIVT